MILILYGCGGDDCHSILLFLLFLLRILSDPLLQTALGMVTGASNVMVEICNQLRLIAGGLTTQPITSSKIITALRPSAYQCSV